MEIKWIQKISAVPIYISRHETISKSANQAVYQTRYCIISTGCSNNASHRVLNWTYLHFVHASLNINQNEFPLPKKSKIQNSRTELYMRELICRLARITLWTFAQWTRGITHHRPWTCGRNGTPLRCLIAYSSHNTSHWTSLPSHWNGSQSQKHAVILKIFLNG